MIIKIPLKQFLTTKILVTPRMYHGSQKNLLRSCGIRGLLLPVYTGIVVGVPLGLVVHEYVVIQGNGRRLWDKYILKKDVKDVGSNIGSGPFH